MMDLTKGSHEKSKLVDINPHLTCFLCKGYYIDATTISECLHSFCRSCIIKFLHEHSYCPICEVIINKAKPNLKLDKTLQDIVYKLVPELFLNEMKRRQRFYQNHPDLATKVTPEERGEDTERTIFNPRDTISLSIEYISDDSTPGAILMPELIGKREDVNNKNKTQFGENEENSAIKRFLQCPGMCRVAVLKKFIRNKYNVDTNQYHIDMLYKRVPLPDHYTLIDIAYIYSYKRNEPMKFFFKITDKSLVNDNFDYLIQPQLIKHDQISSAKASEKKTHKNVKSTCNLKTDSKSEKPAIVSEKPTIVTEKPAIVNEKLCDNDKKEESDAKDNKTNKQKEEYTNLTLDRSNNMEIITKIQKVSNKNGLPIGIKITKQMVKKSATPKSDKNFKDAIKKEEPLVSEPLPEVDEEKSNFLKSFELTAKNALPTSPPKATLPNETLKRKYSFEKQTSKKPKKSPESSKNSKNSETLKVVNNVNENVSKLMEADKAITGNNLQALLFDSYKINIPASLSVTVKSEKDNNTPSSIQKPVQNYIEILKIPDRPSTPSNLSLKNSDFSERPKLSILERLNTSVEVNKVEIKVEDGEGVNKIEKIDPYDFCQNEIKEEMKEEEQTSKGSYQSTAAMKSKSSPSTSVVSSKVPPKENLAKLNPRTPQTFQKMFEEAIKKPEFNSKFQTVSAKTDTANNKQTPKRRISEIASKLIKKTKMDQEKNEEASLSESKSEISNETLPIAKSPLNVPRITNKRKSKLSEKVGNPPLKDFNTYISSKISPQTVTSLHSPSLGLNYTVSVTQNANNLGRTAFPTKPNLEIETRLSMSPKLPNTSTSPRHPIHSPVRQEMGTLLNIPRAYSTSPKIPSPQHSNKSSISPKTKSPNKESTCKTSSSRKSPTSIATSSPSVSKINSKSVTPHSDNQLLTSNQLLEKYNIQNLAQLTANFNFPANMCVNPTQNQLAAMHQALILRHFEMQNHQNWLNMNPGPLMQYEKYLQSLSKS